MRSSSGRAESIIMTPERRKVRHSAKSSLQKFSNILYRYDILIRIRVVILDRIRPGDGWCEVFYRTDKALVMAGVYG